MSSSPLPTPPSQTQTLTLCGVLSETKRIINAHSRHFLALSVLFLLPLSFSFILYPLLINPISSSSLPPHPSLFFFLSSSSDDDDQPISPSPSSLLLPLLYSLFILLFSLFSTASITHSSLHAFFGRPVKLPSSLKSIFSYFFPLLITLIAAQLIIGLVLFAFGGVSVVLYNGFLLFGVDVDFTSLYVLVFVVLMAGLITGFLMYLRVEWYLASVVVVVESKWGFVPLKRSAYLVRGMRWVAFRMMVFFGSLIGLLSLLCSSLVPNAGEVSGKWVGWAFVFQAVVYAGFMTILMLYAAAANTVLYMYCKALHGELAFEIAEEFARDYVSLPFDDGKVPHVVYVV